MDRKAAESLLMEKFKISSFYDEQWVAIDHLLRGKRVLMIQRTGFGKSLCYQFPALVFDGLTIVFSPLIALMRDQVASLSRKGIPAASINSEQTLEENREVLGRALSGRLKILYIAPERQGSFEWMEAVQELNISMVVVDEAHTISTWGHDFRPAFKRIVNLVASLPENIPVLAVTATATRQVESDIAEQINVSRGRTLGQEVQVLRGSLDRPNLALQVLRVQSEDEKLIWLMNQVPQLPGTGLIYTGTRADSETYAEWLSYNGVDAVCYHAGLDEAQRQEIESGLHQNKYKCIVSTNALGMGIDKPDIRFIIHTQIPTSPIHYYQEIGRAGRDGETSYIVLLYNEKPQQGKDYAVDEQLPRSFIESSRPPISMYQRVIALLQREPLGERAIMMSANLRVGQVRTIKADLLDQGIIQEVLHGRSKVYEYRSGAPDLDVSKFEAQRKRKLQELQDMVGYVYTEKPRMGYLCSFLESDETTLYRNCDNTDLPQLSLGEVSQGIDKLKAFRSQRFPTIELATSSSLRGTGYKLSVPYPDNLLLQRAGRVVARCQGSLDAKLFDDEGTYRRVAELAHEHFYGSVSRLTDGYAVDYYGTTEVGMALHASKYEDAGDFPDFLLERMCCLYERHYSAIDFDLLLYVPPTKSGALVRNFACRLSEALDLPIAHIIRKSRETEEQKMFQNSYGKRQNVEGAFEVLEPHKVAGKTILLLDDIYDSGVTLEAIGELLTKHGARWVMPIVIAKTVGGTL